MKKLLILVILLAAGAAALWHYRNPLAEKGVEAWLHATQDLYFEDTLNLEGLEIDSYLRASVQEISGSWQSPEGPFAFTLENLRILDPVTFFLTGKPVHLTFERFAPAGSAQPGISGKAVLYNDKAGTLELEADFIGLHLEELTALNPETLQGSSGRLTGSLYVKALAEGSPELRIHLKVTPPGGRLQARFFEILVPYLPAGQKAILDKMSASNTVEYKEADIQVSLGGPETVNLVFHILVPDYNLNLNLNVALRVESQEMFFQLANVFGLIRIES